MKTIRVMAAVGVVWAGIGVAAGQAGTEADSSAALRNDKQSALGNDGQSALGNDRQSALGNDGQRRAMRFVDLMAMKRVSDPQVSPSGKWVMFSVTDVSLEKNTKVNHLWVVPLVAGVGGGTNTGILPSGQNDKQEKQVTFGTGESFGRFSPDGKFVSYTGEATKDDRVARITIATWDEATGTIGVGRTLKAVSGDADGAIWSPDSKHFLFTTDVYPECSDKPTWTEEDACDAAKDQAADKSPVKAQVWDALLYRHWDHYTGKKRSHIIEADFSLAGANPRDLTPASAVGDAETPTFFLGEVQNYAWAPDSKEIAYVTNLDAVPAASTNNDVFTLRLDEPGAKAVKVSTSPGSDDEPEYSPDGKWLAFRSQARAGFESDRFRLMVFDREKKTIKEVMPNFDRWVDEFTWGRDAVSPEPVWRIYFASGDRGSEPIFRVKVDGSDLEQLNIFGEYGELQVTLDGSKLVSGRMSVAEPTKLISIDLEHIGSIVDGPRPSKTPPEYLPTETDAAIKVDNETQLTHINDALLARLDLDNSIDDGTGSFYFPGAGGTRVQGFIIKPPGFEAGKKYPVKFLMHGGPQTAWGDAWSYRWNWELMAASGYVMVGINRRGSTGYGQKFVDEVSGDWGGRAYEDLMKGLDYVETHYSFIDKTRECALGASYGGFMADWVLTHTNRFKCIVTHDGMYDPVAAYGSTEEMWFNEWEFRRPEDFPKGWDGFGASYNPMEPTHRDKAAMNGAPGFGGGTKANTGVLRSAQNDKQESSEVGRPGQPWRYQDLAADEDPFRRWSPMRFIENAKTPTLVIHSQRDYRLDVSQGMELFTALQRLGVPSKMLYFPDEGHWVLKPQNAQLWNQVVGDWCDRWTKTGKYAEKR